MLSSWWGMNSWRVVTRYLEVGEFAVQLVGHELLEGDL